MLVLAAALLAASAPLQTAIATGDPTGIDFRTVEAALLDHLENDVAFIRRADKIALFALRPNAKPKRSGRSLISLSWSEPSAVYFDASELRDSPAILWLPEEYRPDGVVSNFARPIMRIGTRGATRWMAWGANPYKTSAVMNDQMRTFARGSIDWVLGRRFNPRVDTITIGLSQLMSSQEAQIIGWLGQFGDAVEVLRLSECEGPATAPCLARADLVFTGNEFRRSWTNAGYGSSSALALSQGVPVIFVPARVFGGGAEPFGLAINMRRRSAGFVLEDFNILDDFAFHSPKINYIRRMVRHLADGTYDFDWQKLTSENKERVPGLEPEFLFGADAVRTLLGGLDAAKIRLFDEPGRNLEKLLVLLGDTYRPGIVFPLHKGQVADTDFFRSLYADHAVYNQRDINPGQPSLGTFSRGDFSHVEATSRTISLASSAGSFRATGSYALPGRSFRVTRTDAASSGVSIGINSLRSGSTRLWGNVAYDTGYVRPLYLKSPAYPIRPGETLVLTSPYGGPIQAHFDGNGEVTTLEFENVGEHPYWRSSADDQRFAAKIAANDYDWVEIATPFVEVHSHARFMPRSLALYDGNLSALTRDALRFVFDLPHALAGYAGPGITPIPEIVQFAGGRGIPFYARDLVMHVNSDRSSCGSACSGIPLFDSSRPFDPLHHGVLHELGHGLQIAGFQGWPGHAMTNYYAYYAKSRDIARGGQTWCNHRIPYDQFFEVLNDAAVQSNRQSYLQDNLWRVASWRTGTALFAQLMLLSEHQGHIEDRFHVMSQYHLLARHFERSDHNETTWNAERLALGFPEYSFESMRRMSHNDRVFTQLSVASGMDLSDWLTMWGIEFSEEAAQKVAGLALPKAPELYFALVYYEFCENTAQPALTVDGNSSWIQTDASDRYR